MIHNEMNQNEFPSFLFPYFSLLSTENIMWVQRSIVYQSGVLIKVFKSCQFFSLTSTCEFFWKCCSVKHLFSIVLFLSTPRGRRSGARLNSVGRCAIDGIADWQHIFPRTRVTTTLFCLISVSLTDRLSSFRFNRSEVTYLPRAVSEYIRLRIWM
jgi:hypothetical protein